MKKDGAKSESVARAILAIRAKVCLIEVWVSNSSVMIYRNESDIVDSFTLASSLFIHLGVEVVSICMLQCLSHFVGRSYEDI